MSAVIDKYFLLLFEYLHIMRASSYVESTNTHSVNPNIVQVGWNTVTHVYAVAFLRLKNVEDAFQKAQNGMYCFLEYVEQISKQTVLVIEPLEATVFVYDKVLAPVTDAPTATATVTVIHPTDLHTNIQQIEKLNHLANLLLIHEWALDDQIRIAEDLFYKFAHLFLSDPSMEFDALFQYIDMVKHVWLESSRPLCREEWVFFLNTLYKYTKRAIKQKTVPTLAQVEEKCLALKTMGPPGNHSETEIVDMAKFVFL